MSSDEMTTPGNGGARETRPETGRGCGGRDAGHEAVGQALLISIGLAGMLAATSLAAASVGGLMTVVEALR